jgi:hypothetical protein
MDPLAPMKWAASRARSFRYFQRPYLLPRWLRWIGWAAVSWTFYGIFVEIGLVNVYRRYLLPDSELFDPPRRLWIFSPADQFGLLSTFGAPLDQIVGLVAALVFSGLIALTMHLRRSALSALMIVAMIPLSFYMATWLFLASAVQFRNIAVRDGLNDFSMPPEAFPIGGEVEFLGSTIIPVPTCICIAVAASLQEIYRHMDFKIRC